MDNFIFSRTNDVKDDEDVLQIKIQKMQYGNNYGIIDAKFYPTM